MRRAEADQGGRADRPTTAGQEELKRPRKENAELRRTGETLKAAGTFSGSPGIDVAGSDCRVDAGSLVARAVSVLPGG